MKFGKQIAKIILSDKPGEIPLYATEDEHPTKRRRLGKKANREEIESMFPSINWQTALQIADRTPPRVGIQIVETGKLMEVISKLCPQHQVHYLVVCRGSDRYVGPSCHIDRGVAGVRKRICIRRRFEDIHIDEEWEPWEKLSYKALCRKGVAARVSVFIFAKPKISSEDESQMQSSADAPIHERPTTEESDAKRAKTVNAPEVTSHPTEQSAKHREFVDWTSQKHGPKFLKLSKETQLWLLKIHRNLGHPGATKLKEFCKQVGCPTEVLEAIDHLKCSTCEESKGPTIARPSAIHIGDFNDCISMDGVTWTNKNGHRMHFYHFVDHSTAFQTAICAPSRTTEAAIKAIVQGWSSWAGAPGVLCLDAATELNAEEYLAHLHRKTTFALGLLQRMPIGKRQGRKTWRNTARDSQENGHRT